MAVYKRYKGAKITSRHPEYANARWWTYKRLKGHKTLHQSIPEARTKEDAEIAERHLVAKMFNKRYGIADTATTFRSFTANKYANYVQQHNVNKGAKDLYVRILNEHFGDRPLADITPQDCRDVQYAIQHKRNLRRKTEDGKPGDPLSQSSVNRIMSTASKIFALACEEGILDRNPMQYVKMLKEPPPRKRLLTADEKENLWTELEKDPLMFRLVTLAVNLPLRRAQLLAITPDAVDLQNGVLSVIHSKGRRARIVPLNATARNTLTLMLQQGQLPFPLKDFRKRWSPALVRSGINRPDGSRQDNFHFHDLRKEFASELIRRNVNPNIVQKLFAHSDMSITNIYMDADAESLFEAVKTLDDDVQQSPLIQ